MRKDTRVSCLEKREPSALWGAGRAGGEGRWKKANFFQEFCFVSKNPLKKTPTQPNTKIQGSNSFIPFQGELHGRAAPAHTVITCSAQIRSEALGFNSHFKRGALAGKGSFPTVSLGTAPLNSQRHLLVGCLFKGFCV